MNGKFITFEGGDGAGKTSLVKALKEKLGHKGIEVIITREPGGTVLSEQIRGLLLSGNSITSKAELLLFLAARAQHVEELIIPALQAGKWVLCDRFTDSTLAYQGAGRAIDIADVKNLCNFAASQLQPDVTFLLDIDPVIGLNRTQRIHKDTAKLGDLDRIESESFDFHQRIREFFLEIAQQDKKRILLLDASQSIEHVQTEAWEKIEKLLSA